MATATTKTAYIYPVSEIGYVGHRYPVSPHRLLIPLFRCLSVRGTFGLLGVALLESIDVEFDVYPEDTCSCLTMSALFAEGVRIVHRLSGRLPSIFQARVRPTSTKVQC
jgi:hypothetical protein